MSDRPLLEVRGLSVSFPIRQGPFMAISGIDLDLGENGSMAIMGESGCGKSVLGHAILRLLDDVAEVSGHITFDGLDLCSLDKEDLWNVLGRSIGLVPQSPSTAFNPVLRVGHQMVELIQKCQVARGPEARNLAISALARVGFPDPEQVFSTYPHRLSGGMCERALIAMATSVNPRLMIADEPTKGLDNSSKDTVIELLCRREGSLLMITHDFLAAKNCHEVAVMYAGEIVEQGRTEDVLMSPKHPYTQGLMGALPRNGMRPIPGASFSQDRTVKGCRFRSRCQWADGECAGHPLLSRTNGWRVRCFHA